MITMVCFDFHQSQLNKREKSVGTTELHYSTKNNAPIFRGIVKLHQLIMKLFEQA